MIFAYLEPGSGSLILQAVLGGLAGVSVAYKAFRARMLSRKLKPEAETAFEDEPRSAES